MRVLGYFEDWAIWAKKLKGGRKGYLTENLIEVVDENGKIVSAAKMEASALDFDVLELRNAAGFAVLGYCQHRVGALVSLCYYLNGEFRGPFAAVVNEFYPMSDLEVVARAGATVAGKADSVLCNAMCDVCVIDVFSEPTWIATIWLNPVTSADERSLFWVTSTDKRTILPESVKVLKGVEIVDTCSNPLIVQKNGVHWLAQAEPELGLFLILREFLKKALKAVFVEECKVLVEPANADRALLVLEDLEGREREMLGEIEKSHIYSIKDVIILKDKVLVLKSSSGGIELVEVKRNAF